MTKRARQRLREFEFRCPKCKTVHKRSSWSVAHIGEDQTFTCDCGEVVELPGVPYTKRRKP